MMVVAVPVGEGAVAVGAAPEALPAGRAASPARMPAMAPPGLAGWPARAGG